MTKDLYPYTQLLKTNKKNTNNQIEKWAMNMNKQLTWEMQMAIKFRKMFKLTSNERNAN